MGKGLGKTQQFVLDRLKAKARPLTTNEIAGDTYYPEHDSWAWNPPTHAQIVAVRRAIRTLEERGLVECSLVQNKDLNEIASRQLFCWLPGQPPPKGVRRPNVSSETVEKAVIEALTQLHADEFAAQHEMKDGFYRYSAFVQIASKLLSIHYKSDNSMSARVAIKRAVTKLRKTGKIQTQWRRTGIDGWIRLNVM